MNLLDSLLLSIGLYFFAIGFTILALWLTFQSILIGNAINRVTIFVWGIAIVLWLSIGLRDLLNFILNDTMAQFVIVASIVIYLLFVPSSKQVQKKVKIK